MIKIAIYLLLMLNAQIPLSVAADLSPKEILDIADRARGKLPGLTWKARLVTVEDDRTLLRDLIIKVNGDKSLAVFTSPEKVNGQVFLRRGNNMWFVRPGLKKPTPISTRQQLLGGASNGDIASTNYARDYEPVLKGIEAVDGEDCYILDLTAADKRVTYDRIVYRVSIKRRVGIQAEFYAVSGKLLKTARFDYNHSIRYNGEEIPFISRMTIYDPINPSNITTFDYSDVKVTPIPDSTFNLDLLVRE